MKNSKRYFFSLFFSSFILLAIFSCDKDEQEPEKIFANIEITKLPDRTSFQLGEEPDFTGLLISEVYTDGSKKANTTYKVNWSANILKKGTTKVTVTARSRELSFEISFTGDLVDTGIPVIYINTENQAEIAVKDTYVNANMIIKDKGEVVSENTLRIKGRGNATWTYPKKPYRLKLDEKANIFNMGEDKDWVLLANYCDKTLLRTSIAFKLSKLMNFPWTVKDQFVELVLNGNIWGIINSRNTSSGIANA